MTARVWAETLTTELRDHVWAVRALETSTAGWTHHLLLQTEYGCNICTIQGLLSPRA